jgi:hypothetical protein
MRCRSASTATAVIRKRQGYAKLAHVRLPGATFAQRAIKGICTDSTQVVKLFCRHEPSEPARLFSMKKTLILATLALASLPVYAYTQAYFTGNVEYNVTSLGGQMGFNCEYQANGSKGWVWFPVTKGYCPATIDVN